MHSRRTPLSVGRERAKRICSEPWVIGVTIAPDAIKLCAGLAIFQGAAYLKPFGLCRCLSLCLCRHTQGFGAGMHFCLGSSLARLKLRVVFEELLRSNLDFNFDGEP